MRQSERTGLLVAFTLLLIVSAMWLSGFSDPPPPKCDACGGRNTQVLTSKSSPGPRGTGYYCADCDREFWVTVAKDGSKLFIVRRP